MPLLGSPPLALLVGSRLPGNGGERKFGGLPKLQSVTVHTDLVSAGQLSVLAEMLTSWNALYGFRTTLIAPSCFFWNIS